MLELIFSAEVFTSVDLSVKNLVLSLVITYWMHLCQSRKRPLKWPFAVSISSVICKMRWNNRPVKYIHFWCILYNTTCWMQLWFESMLSVIDLLMNSISISYDKSWYREQYVIRRALCALHTSCNVIRILWFVVTLWLNSFHNNTIYITLIVQNCSGSWHSGLPKEEPQR